MCASNLLDTYVFENMLCVGSESSTVCKGDSGGPLGCFKSGYFTLMGVTSSGRPCEHPLPAPGSFVKVCNYLPWINSIIKQSK